MRTATKYMIALFVFGALLGTLYWFISYEPAGAVLLWSFSLMPLIVAAYAVYHGAMRDRWAQDDPEATAQRSSGEDLGTFPAATVWPIFLVLGVITTGASLVYGLILLPAGIGLMGWAVFGLMRESRS